jgi:hypothetical protein
MIAIFKSLIEMTFLTVECEVTQMRKESRRSNERSGRHGSADAVTDTAAKEAPPARPHVGVNGRLAEPAKEIDDDAVRAEGSHPMTVVDARDRLRPVRPGVVVVSVFS